MSRSEGFARIAGSRVEGWRIPIRSCVGATCAAGCEAVHATRMRTTTARTSSYRGRLNGACLAIAPSSLSPRVAPPLIYPVLPLEVKRPSRPSGSDKGLLGRQAPQARIPEGVHPQPLPSLGPEHAEAA